MKEKIRKQRVKIMTKIMRLEKENMIVSHYVQSVEEKEKTQEKMEKNEIIGKYR